MAKHRMYQLHVITIDPGNNYGHFFQKIYFYNTISVDLKMNWLSKLALML